MVILILIFFCFLIENALFGFTGLEIQNCQFKLIFDT